MNEGTHLAIRVQSALYCSAEKKPTKWTFLTPLMVLHLKCSYVRPVQEENWLSSTILSTKSTRQTCCHSHVSPSHSIVSSRDCFNVWRNPFTTPSWHNFYPKVHRDMQCVSFRCTHTNCRHLGATLCPLQLLRLVLFFDFVKTPSILISIIFVRIWVSLASFHFSKV